MDTVFRQAARLLVLDPANTVLLFQYEDAGRTWWVAPGGGLEADETFEEAAVREAAEELGVRRPSLTPLWSGSVEFSFRGRTIRQVERYFLTRLARNDVADTAAIQDAHRLEGIVATRWWSLGEIEATSEQVYPENICQLLRECINHQVTKP